MKITLTQNEIFEAITGYVGQRMNLAGNEKIEIDLTASRGPQGYTATVDIQFPVTTGLGNVTAAAPHDDAQQIPATTEATSPVADAVAAAATSGDNIFG